MRSIRELLDAAPQNQANDIDAQRAKALVALIKDMGLQATPKVRMVGQYEIDSADPLGEGPGWVDVRAKHPALPDEYRRIRLYDVPPKATATERQRDRADGHTASTPWPSRWSTRGSSARWRC